MIKFDNDWDEILAPEFAKSYYTALREFLKLEYQTHTIYPPMHDLFNCFKLTPYKNVKIVILGQDPYHGAGQAQGLCFSVPETCVPPPSLVNIFSEIEKEFGGAKTFAGCAQRGCLKNWANQGVFLLNTLLTVRAGAPLSHAGKGWEVFTDTVIKLLNERIEPIVFMLWGSPARKKAALITNPNHLVLEAPHPSPLSAYNGFFGCGHFKRANEFLESHGKPPIEWL